MLTPLKPRILVIDDEPAVGELLRRQFEISGEYFVLSVADPNGALNLARSFRPDLTILDVNMPGVDGVELARAIRQEPWLRHRPLVFYTAMSQREKECWRAGGEGPTAFVPKGTSLQDVLAAVEQLVAPRLEVFREFYKSCKSSGLPTES